MKCTLNIIENSGQYFLFNDKKSFIFVHKPILNTKLSEFISVERKEEKETISSSSFQRIQKLFLPRSWYCEIHGK